MRIDNGIRGVATSCAVWAALVISLTPAVGQVQDRPETERPAPAGPPIAPQQATADPSQPPGPAEAMAAYKLVDGWVRSASVPEPPDAASIPRVMGAAVVLRQDGEIVGRGVDMTTDGLALWRASRAAWAEASGRLGVQRDALMETSLRQAAAGLTISVELSGTPVPMLGAGYPDMTAELDPGLTGLAVRAGDRTRAVFPAAMLASGTMPDEAFAIALLDLFEGDQAKAMDDTLALIAPTVLREREGVTFLRFRVTHLAQWSPRGAPVFLHRGGWGAAPGAISVASLREMADGMAAHLVGRAWPGPDGYGMFGRLNPVTGRYDPRFADAAEQAAAALALRRYAATAGVNRDTADAAAVFAIELLGALAKVQGDETPPWADPASAAACVVAYLEGGRPRAGDEVTMGGLLPQCASAVEAAFEPGAGFKESVPPAAKGLVAWALVRMALDTGNVESRSRAHEAVRAVYAGTPTELLVGQMPWLGWAELELASDGEVPAEVALRDLREAVWKHQLGPEDVGPEDRDFVGGVVFTRSQTPLPGWNTARPLAFMATMLGDGRLTGPEESTAELLKVIDGLRFLRQLCVDEPATYMFKGPARRTVGGVRAALWDVRMPPDATSLSLLTVCEALRSLERMQNSRAPEQQNSR
jgi:hypothetical protein